MPEKAKRKGGGAKLSRSETVTVRLDPKLRYLADLAARKQRRTLSSFCEWAIEDALSRVVIYQEPDINGDHDISVADEAAKLWDVDESERFVRLATSYPDLLNHEEQELWKLLNDSCLLAPAKRRTSTGNPYWDLPVLEDKIFPALRFCWPDLKAAYEKGADASREWVRGTRKKLGPEPGRAEDPLADLENDIPF
jgi:hypothetical protein